MPMSGLPEDAIERFFEKSSEKRSFRDSLDCRRYRLLLDQFHTGFRVAPDMADLPLHRHSPDHPEHPVH